MICFRKTLKGTFFYPPLAIASRSAVICFPQGLNLSFFLQQKYVKELLLKAVNSNALWGWEMCKGCYGLEG